jgi:nucleotide sugar dehydrogenase
MPDASSELRLTVIGTGYLGATHAACMAELGFQVLGVDTDREKTALLSRGEAPFYEPGLAEILQRNLASGRLRFTSSYEEAAEHGDVHFLCVGTPQTQAGHAADLTHLNQAVGALAPLLHRQCLVVGKSTVPVGTAAALAQSLASQAPAGAKVVLAWNPEFLREGFAVNDSLHPDRIVIGVPPDRAAAAWAEGCLLDVYAPMTGAGTPLIVTGYTTAELVKVAANAFLATKISFINAMAEVCEFAEADVTALARALSHDERIGARFLSPGLGFGGGCLPKDIRAFRARAAELGVGHALEFLREIDSINDRCRSSVVELARELAGGSLDGQQIAILGGAFKPGSDDVRDSPALAVASAISAEGASVKIFDPKAMAGIRRTHHFLSTVPTALDAIRGARLVLLLTEWPEFRDLSPYDAGEVAAARVIIDARHALDSGRWQEAGWLYRAHGRPAVTVPRQAPSPIAVEVKDIRTCVRVGLGVSGDIHHQALSRLGVRTIAVLDSDPDRRIAKAAPDMPAFASYAEVAAHSPGFWDVCVPTSVHPEVFQAIIAADPEANILIEKPLCDFADLPEVSQLLARHRGRVVVHENYASSAVPAAVAERVRDLGLRLTGVWSEMSKNRTRDFLEGRFVDEYLGSFGYEGTHLLTVVEAMGRDDLDGEPGDVTMTDLTLPDGTTLARQGTASVTLPGSQDCPVRLYTSVDGAIGHPHRPYAPSGRQIPADDIATRYRVLCAQGADADGQSYHVAGFFEPVSGQPRGLGVLATYRNGVQIGEPEVMDDDTVTKHLKRTIAYFGGDPDNPFPVARAIRHVQYLRRWANRAVPAPAGAGHP